MLICDKGTFVTQSAQIPGICLEYLQCPGKSFRLFFFRLHERTWCKLGVRFNYLRVNSSRAPN